MIEGPTTAARLPRRSLGYNIQLGKELSQAGWHKTVEMEYHVPFLAPNTKNS